MEEEQPSLKEKESNIDLLPTDKEIAKQGRNEFEQVASKINDYEIAQMFLHYPGIKTCFTGLTPESRDIFNSTFYKYQYGDNWESIYIHDIDLLRDLIDSVSSNYLFLGVEHLDYERDRFYYTASMVNIRAARKVISQNPDLFPSDAVEHTEQWLSENMDEWMDSIGKNKISNARYGLLSGIPRKSVERYWDYNLIRTRLYDQDQSSEKLDVLSSHDDEDFDTNPEKQLQYFNLINDLSSQVGGISKEVINDIQSSKRMGLDKIRGLSFISFDPEKDQKYLDDLERIYNQSGIDTVTIEIFEERFR